MVPVDVSLDTDSSDFEFPPVLQEQLQAEFAGEKEQLLAQIAALSADAAQSQQAFDTYRERAKQSLQKAAAEQRVSEGAAAVLRDQAQVG
jgi:molecular chaperone GrpE (heat shock protein)